MHLVPLPADGQQLILKKKAKKSRIDRKRKNNVMTTEIKHNISATLERSVCRKEETQFVSYSTKIKESLYMIPIVLNHGLLSSKKVLARFNDCMYNL